MAQRVGDKLATQLYQAALDTEEQLDNEIDRLQKLKDDDLEEIRRKRLEAMKDDSRKRKEALAKGTGVYDELKDEKEFFEQAKKNTKMVCVFYREGAEANQTIQKHFDILCKRYWMVRFCRLQAEKAPYLAEKLHIWMLPSIVLIKEGKTEYTIRGLDEVGGLDCPLERLESLLSYKEIIPELN